VKLYLPGLLVAALLALPASSHAANVGVLPDKRCYRSGERVGFLGNGFTPGGRVTIAADGAPIGLLSTDATGTVAGQLTVVQRRGERLKTYTATDQPDPALSASTRLRVSALDVRVRPRSNRPGRKVRIRARGFTGSKHLWAHLVRGRYRRNVKVGRLRRSCRRLFRRKRLFPRRTRPGVYRVQFDGKRRYRRSTAVQVSFRVVVFRTVGRSAASTGESWTRLR
jgi:hypothetical protein